MNASLASLSAVVRMASERTAPASVQLARRILPAERVVSVSEIPFSRAVRRTYEIGQKLKAKWTAAIDADVLISADGLQALVALAEEAPASLFEIEGCIWDKLFGGPRSGGIHLYRTCLLEEALNTAKWEEATHRPEYSVICAMKERGYTQERHEIVVGLHDYEQYRKDYFRKGVSVARKFKHHLWFFEPMWRRLAQNDLDFEAALAGLQFGKEHDGLSLTDIGAAENLIREHFARLGVPERASSCGAFRSPSDVTRFLSRLTPQPEFSVWNAWRLAEEQKHAERLRRRLASPHSAAPLGDAASPVWLNAAFRIKRVMSPVIPQQIKTSIQKIITG